MTKRKSIKAPKCLMIPYYRVSTDRQGESGLGLEAQKSIVEKIASQNGCSIPREFVEIETGKRSDRPELAKAIEHAKQIGATLVVAKLDRLARNTRFLLALIESGVDVLFGDLPEIPPGAMGKFLLTQMASVAELEAGLISERTKAALDAYRARGGRLGGQIPECRNLTEDARRKGREIQATQAREAYAEIAPDVLRLRSEGMTLRQIADDLNSRGITTRTGSAWTAVQVQRVLRWHGAPSEG